MDNPFELPSILSLCPGVLGLERGLIRAIGRVRVVAYVEIESVIIANLVAAMEQGILDPAPVWSNVKTFKGEWVRNKIHGIIGGYPCQPFSHAGARNGLEDPRHLYPYISGIIAAAGPVWCFFENVEGHLSLGYPEVSADLRSMGYAVEAGIYSAEEVGAPHERDRLFILAIKHEYLAHANGNGDSQRDGRGSVEYSESESESESEIRERERIWIKPSPGCKEEVADTAIAGLENRRKSQPGKQPSIKRSCGAQDRWPSRPGDDQFEWEEPRIVKSGVGCTVDGYNFREDLLRAYGNSVVEQTAEIAFNDLLQKHLDNYSK